MLRSLLVKDYMTADPLVLAPEMDVLDAIHQLLRHEMTGAPVADHLGKLLGYLAERDCLKVALTASYHEQRGGRVSEYMTKSIVTLDFEASLTEAAELFLANPAFRCFPVLADSRLVGQLTRRDILKAFETVW